MDAPDSLIYNVTTMVNHQVHGQWIAWMKEKHIPDVMASGCFTRYQMVRLLDTDEAEGLTYAVQYYCASQAEYERYIHQFAPALRNEVKKLFGDNQVSFRTLMGIVQ